MTRPAWHTAGSDAPKAYRDGTHRTTDPAQTLARVRPHLATIGITRIAMLTGLDTIGIPVAVAYRPNSRSISVHQGKGTNVLAAKASAVMEALETHHAETADLPLRLGSHTEIRRHGKAVDPAALPQACGGIAADHRILWTEGRDLVSHEPVWVPQELVGMDLASPLPAGSGIFQATTNGLASGNHWMEAAIHAVCELVERDAVTLWFSGRVEEQDARAVDLETIDGAAVRRLLACLAAADMRVRIWDVSSDVRLPVFVCLIASADGVQPEIGSGCHLDREIALLRAITEAAQARLTVISGARDDLPEAVYREEAVRRRRKAAQSFMGSPARRAWQTAPSCAGATLGADLAAALDRLCAAGFDQVIHVDLTMADIGIPVARVIIPGLEGPWTGAAGDYTPGRRARQVAGEPT